MGRVDDNLWELNPHSTDARTLHRPRSMKNNVIYGLNIFGLDNNGHKKRSKTVHVYGADSSKVNEDFLDIISRSKTNSKQSGRSPLQEIDMNTTESENTKSVDLIDMDQILTSQSQSAIPVENTINLLKRDTNESKQVIGPVPIASDDCEIDDIQSQISTVTLGTQDYHRQRPKTLPLMNEKLVESYGRPIMSAANVEIDDESVDNSEDEPELLSTSLVPSQSFRVSRSSTGNAPDENHTFNTSILPDDENKMEDNNSTEIINESQLSNANIQAEDFIKDDYEMMDVPTEPISECFEIHESQNLQLNENDHASQTSPTLNSTVMRDRSSFVKQSALTRLCSKVNDKIITDELKEMESPEIVETPTKQTEDQVTPKATAAYVSNRERKRKTTLSEICSKTNRARLPQRVGLSKKIKLDSLHDYLQK